MTVTTYWKDLFYLLRWGLLLLFLFNQGNLYMTHLILNLLYGIYNIITEHNQIWNHYSFQTILMPGKKWLKNFFYNFICSIKCITRFLSLSLEDIKWIVFYFYQHYFHIQYNCLLQKLPTLTGLQQSSSSSSQRFLISLIIWSLIASCSFFNLKDFLFLQL